VGGGGGGIFVPQNKITYFSSERFSAVLKMYKGRILFLSRQADFLHEVASIDGSLSGIYHWWIGLSDLGRFLSSLSSG
jgi:hypothetical protein